MATTLTLFCLISGELASNAFPVKISSDETVGQLKKAIIAENPNAFGNMDAKNLALWRVTVPVVAGNIAVRLDAIDQKEELLPTDYLSDVFEEAPPKKAIHIIIKRPKVLMNSDF
ncbi:hypothetical protein BGZ58_010047 [Dissophora ornata]|nr:hypothetical protein BGZ58_010047 [Dissophora ornata]